MFYIFHVFLEIIMAMSNEHLDLFYVCLLCSLEECLYSLTVDNVVPPLYVETGYVGLSY